MARARASFAGVGVFLNSFSQPFTMAASPDLLRATFGKSHKEYNRSREYIAVTTTRSNQRIRDLPLGQRSPKTTKSLMVHTGEAGQGLPESESMHQHQIQPLSCFRKLWASLKPSTSRILRFDKGAS